MGQESYDTYIQRVHRQHHSLLVVVPYLLAQRQRIKAGDYLMFTGDEDSKFIKIEVIRQKGAKHGRSKRGSGRKDRDRRTRAKVGDRR